MGFEPTAVRGKKLGVSDLNHLATEAPKYVGIVYILCHIHVVKRPTTVDLAVLVVNSCYYRTRRSVLV